ncbi:Hypothetical protein, putative [Bodo saltans]|uniref:Uncharacterized protein n=1 Tax=Bodo saltans TaxID=75058 RepID=A0A0S4JJQ2_BODSA|nr:Hypothetical protein, putative [Bodo saltans]|eukprot:CUG89241.1 Hypothetical protein, putative [Bodo saltans]
MGCVHSSSDEGAPSVRRMTQDDSSRGLAQKSSISTVRRRRSPSNVSAAPTSMGPEDGEAMSWLDGRTAMDTPNQGSPSVRISRPILHEIPEPPQMSPNGRGLFGRHSAASPHPQMSPNGRGLFGRHSAASPHHHPQRHLPRQGGASLSLLEGNASASGFLAGVSETTPLNPLKGRLKSDASQQQQPQQDAPIVPDAVGDNQHKSNQRTVTLPAKKEHMGRYYTAPGTNTDEANAASDPSLTALINNSEVTPNSPLMSVMKESTDGTDPAYTTAPPVTEEKPQLKSVVIVTTTRGKSRQWRMQARPLNAFTQLSMSSKLAQEVYPEDSVTISALRRKSTNSIGAQRRRSDALRPMSLRAALEEGIDSVTIDSCRKMVQLLRDPVQRTLEEFRARSCPTIRRSRAKHLEEQQRLAALRTSGQDGAQHHTGFRRLGVSFDDSVLRSALGMILQDHIPASLRSLLCPSSSESEEDRLQKKIFRTHRKLPKKNTSSAHIVGGANTANSSSGNGKETSWPLGSHRAARGLCGDTHMHVLNWLRLHSVGSTGKLGATNKVLPPRRAIFPDDNLLANSDDNEAGALALEDADYVGFQIGFRGQYECFRRPFQLSGGNSLNSDNETLFHDANTKQYNKLRLSVGGLCCDENDDSEDSVSVCSFTSEDMLNDDDFMTI